MLRVNPATAWRLLEMAQLRKGAWVVQSGAGTTVARLLAVLAREQGVNVINIVRPHGAVDPATRALADGEGLPAYVAALTGGAPVLAAFDCVAGETTGHLAECLAPGGQLIVYGHLSGRPCQIPSTLLTGRGINVCGFSLRRAENGIGLGALQGFYDRLADWMMHNAPALPVAATLPLSRLAEALALTAERKAGRVMLALDG